VENASTENSSTNEQGWKKQVYGKRKYESATVQQVQEYFQEFTIFQSCFFTRSAVSRLLDYVQRSWLLKASIGPTRLSVSGRIQRTNNGVESFHNSFGQLVKVSYPRFYVFLEYLQEATQSNMADVQRLNTGGQIRRELNE